MSSYANLNACQVVLASMVKDAQFNEYVMGILADPSTSDSNFYDSLSNYLSGVASANTEQGEKTCKILLALDDGTVIVDTSKGAQNTLQNYKDKKINENHNSRPEIMNAVLNSSGVASAVRFSSSSTDVFQYYAVRLGNSPQANLGTIRIAFQA